MSTKSKLAAHRRALRGDPRPRRKPRRNPVETAVLYISDGVDSREHQNVARLFGGHVAKYDASSDFMQSFRVIYSQRPLTPQQVVDALDAYDGMVGHDVANVEILA